MVKKPAKIFQRCKGYIQISLDLCEYLKINFPANSRRWPIVGSMLSQRRKRWANIELMVQRVYVTAAHRGWIRGGLQCKGLGDVSSTH